MTAAVGYMARAAKADWRTPVAVLDLVREVFRGRIDTDPCASPDPDDWFAEVNYAAPGQDGLEEAWAGRVFVNPPFGDLDRWAAACRRAHATRGCEVILLLPARTDTAYWHEEIVTANAVCFWRGRMRFVGAPANAPFPTALVYWGAWPWLFHEVFSAKGRVCAP